MAIINEITEVLYKFDAERRPNCLGKGGGAYAATRFTHGPAPLMTVH
jgi:hypothetical protein